MRCEPRIGVLAIQGAFSLHKVHLVAAGAEYCEVTHPEDLREVDGIILPGGESSVMLKLLNDLKLYEPLAKFVTSKPTWGICAGAILLSANVTNPSQQSLGVIDIDICRNGYGRQMDSSEEVIEDYNVAYIRAPRISRVAEGIEIHHRRNGEATWLESKNIMITTFHPEINLATPSLWHRRFVEICVRNR